MAGLLDFLSTPEGRLGMGLLAAAGPSERPLSFGQRLQMGMQTADDSNNQLMRQKLMQSQVDENASQAELRKLAAAKALAAQEWRNKLTPLMQPRLQGSDPVTNQIAQENNQFGDFGANSAAQLGIGGMSYGPDKEALQRHLYDPASPFADKLLEKQLFPKEDEAYTLGEGQARFVGGKKVAEIAPKVVKTELEKLLDQAGITDPVMRQQFTMQALNKASTHAPGSSVTVQNIGEKEFAKVTGANDAKQLDTWRAGADAAQNTLGLVKSLREADKAGAYSGGGSDAKLAAANLINGLTGVEVKGLVGSQLYNAEASKLVLEKVKMLGANPSNADVTFIQKTVPQLATSSEARSLMADFMEKKARQAIKTYKAADAFARKNSGLGGFDPYQGDAAPAETSPSNIVNELPKTAKVGTKARDLNDPTKILTFDGFKWK